MQKKLLAVAVAGAFVAPAAALAQSTVQIYGKLTYEYAIVDQGAGQKTTDYADTPGGTNVGFKGQEKLGGGLSAWFQCESSADVRGIDNVGFCSRNSAVGFKGNFGNVYFGKWDTPFKRLALGPGSVGATHETGSLGTSFVAWGGSGGARADNKSARQRWKRRESSITVYESPNLSGFQLAAAFTAGNRAADNATAALDATSNAKPRVVSLAGAYKSGPLAIGLGVEQHRQFAAATTGPSLDDRAWGASVSYKIGSVEIGGTYLDAKYETTATTELKRKSWTLGAEWNIAGPHNLMAFYGQADDAKGNSLAGVGDIPASGADTGAKDMSISYLYKFSKRTMAALVWHRTDNDRNAFYALGSAQDPLLGGEKQDAYGIWMSHRF